MTTDPRIQALAAEAAQKIKAVASQYDADIQGIYQQYQQQAALIRAEATSQDLNRLTDDQSSEPYPQHQTH